MTIQQRLRTLRAEGGKQNNMPTESLVGSSSSLLDTLRKARRSGTDCDRRIAVKAGGRVLQPGLVLVTNRQPLGFLSHPVSLPEVGSESVSDWTFLDTETTGLAGGTGTVVFMLGLARIEGRQLVLNQYLATNYAAEKPMLIEAFRWLHRESGLVTYNGKCFDLPLLQTRARMHGLANPLKDRAHLDLLYPVRRAYGNNWPDCRLQTAERKLLGMVRQGDMPGSEAPAAWQDLMKRGDIRRLDGILVHNRRDLISLCELLPVLNRIHRRPWRYGADVHRVARGWARYRKGLPGADQYPNLKLPLE